MSYSSLLVHVDVDGEIGGRVLLAARLADQFHSHLIGVASWMVRPPFVVEGVPIDPEPTEDDYKEMREVPWQAWKGVSRVGGAGPRPGRMAIVA